MEYNMYYFMKYEAVAGIRIIPLVFYSCMHSDTTMHELENNMKLEFWEIGC
jgi:hypothetical protein